MSITNGQYFIEDLRSRNNTFVNNKQVTTRTQLKPSDRLKICDFPALRVNDNHPNSTISNSALTEENLNNFKASDVRSLTEKLNSIKGRDE